MLAVRQLYVLLIFKCHLLNEATIAPLLPLPSLPSPLLCPRRTFLAYLILASKFMQDRSYSNRAWAKLVGLSPREISRCERALGDALDWRLWVGKSIMPCARKPVARSRSENDIVFPGSSEGSMSAAGNAGLRRAATLPAFSASSDLNHSLRFRSWAQYLKW